MRVFGISEIWRIGRKQLRLKNVQFVSDFAMENVQKVLKIYNFYTYYYENVGETFLKFLDI